MEVVTAKINQKVTSASLFVLNDGLGFGRFEHHQKLMYEIEITAKEFISRMETTYQEVRDEIKADDEAYNETSDFSTVNYCSLQELIGHPKTFEEITKTFFIHPIFNVFLPYATHPRYVINSVDTILAETSNVQINGGAFEWNEKRKV